MASTPTYHHTSELPEPVRLSFSEKDQKRYLEAYNQAWNRYAHLEDHLGEPARREAAHRAAWEAVKWQRQRGQATWLQKPRLNKPTNLKGGKNK